jgi:hypothetical protein
MYFSRAFQRGIDEGPQVTKNLRLVDFPPPTTQNLRNLFIENVEDMAKGGILLREAHFEKAWLSALSQFSKTTPRNLRSTVVEQNVKLRPAETQEIPSSVPEVAQRTRSKVESLAKMPVTLRLSITEMLRQKFLLKPDSEHIVSDFRTDGDPFCQLFNSMWIRLGLMDYILYIERGKEKNEYEVTFNSFDAASAFVNRPHEHYIDDKMSGPIYASWDTKMDESDVSATLILPQNTLDVWRQEALNHNVALSKHGYPLVEWTKSMRSVLARMRYSIGMHGDCRLYRVIAEYNYRVVMEVAFKDQDTLNHFLARKTEHFLTNYWKDRFFARARVHLG